jgi:hypothetical protein
MRQLHLLRLRQDQLALEVIARQVETGDEVRVVVLATAAGTSVTGGAEAVDMPPLQYDGLVELVSWCERVVCW